MLSVGAWLRARQPAGRTDAAPMALPALRFERCHQWLPIGKRAAVCFSVDDVHPGSSVDGFDAGGDLGHGALGRLQRLLDRNPQLRATLFVTPDWRLKELVPTRRWLNRVPLARTHVHFAPLHRKGHFRITRHPRFVAFLNGMPRTDIAPHGLAHAHPGPQLATEFQAQPREQCAEMLREARWIFATAGLRSVRGFAPPAWSAPPALCQALIDTGFHFFSSARDLVTPVSCGARSAGSGLQGASLFKPSWVLPRLPREFAGGPASRDLLLHFPTNFQATSMTERAHEIIEVGGLLSVKAHIFKTGGGVTMLDGLDAGYCGFLESLFRQLDQRYGESLWWTSFAEISARCRALRA